jgi:hypothetical protein
MGVGGQRHAPAALSPGKRLGTHCKEGWLGPRASLDGCGKSRPHRDSIPVTSSPKWVAILTELFQPTQMNCTRVYVFTCIHMIHWIQPCLYAYDWLLFLPSGPQNNIFTVAPCISKIHLSSHTNECTKFIYYLKSVLIIHIKTLYSFVTPTCFDTLRVIIREHSFFQSKFTD